MLLLRAGITIALMQAVFLNHPTAHQEHIEVEIEVDQDQEMQDQEMQEYFETQEGFDFLRCVYAEAGNQGYKGMRKVAAVVINRWEDEGFPDTIEGVLKQRYQFSSYPDGWKKWEYDAIESEDCKRAIWDELNERSETDIFWFRTVHYPAYGKSKYKYKDHYFSGR